MFLAINFPIIFYFSRIFNVSFHISLRMETERFCWNYVNILGLKKIDINHSNGIQINGIMLR